MPQVIRENIAEALAGLVVLLLAAWFLVFALERTGSGSGGHYALMARFPNTAGISVGSDVRVSGLKVGSVTAQKLDTDSYQALVTLSVNNNVKLPLDTSAAITSEGLLGGSYIELIPGGDDEELMPGDEIIDTQGATDLMGLVGSFINRSSGDSDTAASNGG